MHVTAPDHSEPHRQSASLGRGILKKSFFVVLFLAGALMGFATAIYYLALPNPGAVASKAHCECKQETKPVPAKPVAADAAMHAMDMIDSHIVVLWTFASALVIAQILIVAHILATQKVTFFRSSVSITLAISILSGSASAVAGYASKMALIEDVIDYARSGLWQVSSQAEDWVTYQIIFVALSIATFVWVFLRYSQIVVVPILALGGLNDSAKELAGIDNKPAGGGVS